MTFSFWIYRFLLGYCLHKTLNGTTIADQKLFFSDDENCRLNLHHVSDNFETLETVALSEFASCQPWIWFVYRRDLIPKCIGNYSWRRRNYSHKKVKIFVTICHYWKYLCLFLCFKRQNWQYHFRHKLTSPFIILNAIKKTALELDKKMYVNFINLFDVVVIFLHICWSSTREVIDL